MSESPLHDNVSQLESINHALFNWLAADPAVILLAAASSDGAEARFTRKALHLMRQHGLVSADFSASQRIDVAEVE